MTTMEKGKVLKALEICANSSGCNACPYHQEHDCDSKMCKDALSLLKANEAPKTHKYNTIIIFTKKGNLSEYFTPSKQYDMCNTAEQIIRVREYYAKEREIQLIAMFRYEGTKVFCKIKCPVNPLPVKGEFEVPNSNVLIRFLRDNGWTFKQKFYPRMLE